MEYLYNRSLLKKGLKLVVFTVDGILRIVATHKSNIVKTCSL